MEAAFWAAFAPLASAAEPLKCYHHRNCHSTDASLRLPRSIGTQLGSHTTARSEAWSSSPWERHKRIFVGKHRRKSAAALEELGPCSNLFGYVDDLHGCPPANPTGPLVMDLSWVGWSFAHTISVRGIAPKGVSFSIIAIPDAQCYRVPTFTP